MPEWREPFVQLYRDITRLTAERQAA